MRAIWITCAAACLLPGADAGAAAYTDRGSFNAAYPGLALQNFNSANDAQRDFGDFLLRSGTNLGAAAGTSTNGFPSRAGVGFNSDDTLDIVFSVPVTAVGLNLGTFDFFGAGPLPDYIALFNPSGGLITQIVPQATNGKAMSTFVGFSDLGPIGFVRIGDLPDQAGMHAVDDVAYGVPEPGAAVLLLGGLAGAARRRRT
jgi:hypothetical protein